MADCDGFLIGTGCFSFERIASHVRSSVHICVEIDADRRAP